jgi:hypothetical protein
MITIFSALVSLLSFRVRSRASLELELVVLRHQVAVLRRGFIYAAAYSNALASLIHHLTGAVGATADIGRHWRRMHR